MDICCTCIFLNNCSLKQRASHRIWDCSEFTIDTPPPAVLNGGLPCKAPSRRKESKGLCQNCDLLETCSWYRDDAVIFHCEHYQ